MANNKTCKPDLNQWLAYGYLGTLELYRTVLRLTSHLMKVQGILVTDVLDGLEECKQELEVLVASPEPVFPFSIQVDESSDHATLTATEKTLPDTTQFKERAKLTERQKKRADKCISKVEETLEQKKVAENR